MNPLYLALVVVVALPFVLRGLHLFMWLPIKLRKAGAMPLRPSPQIVEIDSLTAEMRDFFNPISAAIRALGFEPTPLTSMGSKIIPGSLSAQQLLVNRSTGDVAVIILVQVQTVRSLIYAFRTELADGGRISTGMNRGIGMWTRDPKDSAETFAFVTDPALLYEVHRKRLKTPEISCRGRTPAPGLGEELAYLQKEYSKNIQWPASCGYYRLDEQAGLYRKTWKGTFVMTWKVIGPIKRWRIARRDRRARRVWTELGMGPVSPVPTASMTDIKPVVPLPEPEWQNAQVASTPSQPTALIYQASLREGEIRIERHPTLVVVKAGGPSRSTVIARQKWRILSIVLFGGLLVLNVYQWVLFRLLLQQSSPFIRMPLPPRVLLYLVLLVYECVRLAIAVRRAPGESIVVGTAEGLRYHNASAEGTIPRSQIQSILVAVVHQRWRTNTFGIKVSTAGTAGHKLILSGGDQQPTTEARDALTQAMGFYRAESPTDEVTTLR